MEIRDTSFSLVAYARKNWFQLIVIGLILFVIVRKDFSFQLNFNNPDGIEETTSPTPKKKEKQHLMTQKKVDQPIAKSEASMFNSNPFVGGGSASTKKAELPEINPALVTGYLKRFSHVAISERKKYGVPSSVVLANGLFHSFAGQRDIATNGYNHFGVTCSPDWKGASVTASGQCYRRYENAWTSFRDHSLYVTTGKYSALRSLGATDYKAWAQALERMNFSEFPNLANTLIQLIEKHELHRLDFQ